MAHAPQACRGNATAYTPAPGKFCLEIEAYEPHSALTMRSQPNGGPNGRDQYSSQAPWIYPAAIDPIVAAPADGVPSLPADAAAIDTDALALDAYSRTVISTVDQAG